MFRAAPILALPVLLAACGDTAPPNEGNSIEVAGEQQKALFALSDMNRDIALRRAITGQGLRCQTVTGSGFVGRWENLDQWAATCNDDRQWAIFIGADDTAQVRDCEDVVEAGLPACEVTDKATGVYTEDAAES